MSERSLYKSVEAYYNEFVNHLLYDYIYGNLRVRRQVEFILDALPVNSSDVLLVGCGIGDVVHELSFQRNVNSVCGVDISEACIEVGKKLFADSRISLQVLNVVEEKISGTFDCIVFPDVYEHIPVADRPALHKNITEALRPGGRVIVTVPSPMHQEALIASGKGLQVVDEIVDLDDLKSFADDLKGFISYYNLVGIWSAYDYVHAIIEVRERKEVELNNATRCAIKRNLPRDNGLVARIRRRIFEPNLTRIRKRLVTRTLGESAASAARRMLD